MSTYILTVEPLLTHWRGDTRRNSLPYVCLHDSNFGHIQTVKRELEARGIACFVNVYGKEKGK